MTNVYLEKCNKESNSIYDVLETRKKVMYNRFLVGK